MKRLFICLLALIFALRFPGVFAQEEAAVSEDAAYDFPPMTALTYEQLRGNISNNQYFLESVHYAGLAQASFEEGEYEVSIRYSQEAIRYARLSDEFVEFMLRIWAVDGAIAAAEQRIAWASSNAVNAQSRFAEDYGRAQDSLEAARNSREAESWDEAMWYAYDAIDALAFVYEIGGSPAPGGGAIAPAVPGGSSPLPAQYTVREWAESGDCFWNIAERPWVYNDPHQWRILYEANRSKLADPDNPDVIDPGIILDIPVLGGETRQGMWSPGGSYEPYLPD